MSSLSWPPEGDVTARLKHLEEAFEEEINGPLVQVPSAASPVASPKTPGAKRHTNITHRYTYI